MLQWTLGSWKVLILDFSYSRGQPYCIPGPWTSTVQQEVSKSSSAAPHPFHHSHYLLNHAPPCPVCGKLSSMNLVPGAKKVWTATAKSLQSCLTLCNPMDGSPPGSSVPGILQARTLEWVAISFSNAWKWKVKVKSLNRVQLSATPWTAAYQAPPSMGFSRQEYWSGVP